MSRNKQIGSISTPIQPPPPPEEDEEQDQIFSVKDILETKPEKEEQLIIKPYCVVHPGHNLSTNKKDDGAGADQVATPSSPASSHSSENGGEENGGEQAHSSKHKSKKTSKKRGRSREFFVDQHGAKYLKMHSSDQSSTSNTWIRAVEKAKSELGFVGSSVPERGSALHERATEIKKELQKEQQLEKDKEHLKNLYLKLGPNIGSQVLQNINEDDEQLGIIELQELSQHDNAINEPSIQVNQKSPPKQGIPVPASTPSLKKKVTTVRTK